MLWPLTLVVILRISVSSPSVLSVSTEEPRFAKDDHLSRLTDTSFLNFPYPLVSSYSSSGQVQVQRQSNNFRDDRDQNSQSGQEQISQSIVVQPNEGLPIHRKIERNRKKYTQIKGKNYTQSRQGQIVQVGIEPINTRWIISEENGTTVKEKMVVKKCCPMGQGYDRKKQTCVEVSDSFDTPFWDGHHLIEEVIATEEFNLSIGYPSCLTTHYEELMQASDVSHVLYVRENGDLTMEFPEDRSPAILINPQKYCIDDFVLNENETRFDALVCCFHPKGWPHKNFSFACMLTTCSIILLRVVTFACLPEFRTLHGRIVMAYLISFLVGYFLLTISEFFFVRKIILQEQCTFMMFIIYFLLLSSFFWRNVMCYDIWWTFSGKWAFSSRDSSSRTRFHLYSAYAFGVPILLTVILAAFVFSDLLSTHPLKPIPTGTLMYGYIRMIYFYGPIMSLFVINVIFTTLTAVKIAAIKKETKNILRSNESSIHAQQRAIQRFSLYIKLFAAMSFLEVMWVIDVIALFAPRVKTVFHAIEIYNVLAPLIIFIDSVCQKHTWKIIKKRFKQMRGLSKSKIPTANQPTSQPSGSQTTQSLDDTEI